VSLSLYNQPLLPRSVYTFSDLFRSHVYFQTFVHWSELTHWHWLTELHMHAHAEEGTGGWPRRRRGAPRSSHPPVS